VYRKENHKYNLIFFVYLSAALDESVLLYFFNDDYISSSVLHQIKV